MMSRDQGCAENHLPWDQKRSKTSEEVALSLGPQILMSWYQVAKKMVKFGEPIGFAVGSVMTPERKVSQRHFKA